MSSIIITRVQVKQKNEKGENASKVAHRDLELEPKYKKGGETSLQVIIKAQAK